MHVETDQRAYVALGLAVMLGLLAMLLSNAGGASASHNSADLSLTKSDSPDPVAAGGALSYTIDVANAGHDPATSVTVVDELPKGVSFVSATPTQGSCRASANKQKVTCVLGTIAVTTGPGSTPSAPVYVPGAASITIRVLAPKAAGTITNTASVDSDQTDPNRGNNVARSTTSVVAGKGPGPKPKRASCRGRRVTVLGTLGADVLRGTPGRDVVSARAGGDRIVTLGGKDLICAGRGNDQVKSGGRPDTVFAGPGGDRLFGGAGGDVLRGSLGRDLIRGGGGRDLIAGGRAGDRCIGGPGLDIVRTC